MKKEFKFGNTRVFVRAYRHTFKDLIEAINDYLEMPDPKKLPTKEDEKRIRTCKLTEEINPEFEAQLLDIGVSKEQADIVWKEIKNPS